MTHPAATAPSVRQEFLCPGVHHGSAAPCLATSARALLWLFCVGLGNSATAAAQNKLPDGVGPRDADRYAAALSGQGFHCLDRAGATLPAATVNDDFCDCADGSDEPGTGACAGREGSPSKDEVFFFCANPGAQPRYLYRSRVNDGICDCCDGSDEARSGACANTCAEDGRAFREAEIRRVEVWQKGMKLQEELVSLHKRESESWSADAKQLRAELPGLERQNKLRKQALEEAKAKLPPTPEAVLKEPAEDPPTKNPASAGFPRPQEGSVEDISGRLQELRAVLDPGLKGDRRALAALRSECKEITKDQYQYRLCFFRDAFQTSNKKGSSKESPVSIGVWSGWDFSEDPPLARFDGGAECPGGALRKLAVSFRCSSRAKLKTVTEPETCSYKAELLHPGACDSSRAPDDGAEESRQERWQKTLSRQQELLQSVEAELASWRTEAQELEAKLAALQGSDSSEGVAAADSKPSGGAGAEQPKISEYAKWMDSGAPGIASSAPVPGAAAPAVAPEAQPAAEVPAEPSPDAPGAGGESPEQKAHRETQAEWEEASRALREAKHRLWGLEARLHPGLTGGWLALGGLVDQCLSKQADGFSYRVCFFRQAQQDTKSEKGLSLGRWMGWDLSGGQPRAHFGRGSVCGNGLRRSLTVAFACGEKPDIESVREKEACVYEADAVHPGACDASAQPERHELPALLPREEL